MPDYWHCSDGTSGTTGDCWSASSTATDTYYVVDSGGSASMWFADDATWIPADTGWQASPEPIAQIDPEEVERQQREEEERQAERDAVVEAAEAILAEHLELTYGKEFAAEAKENGFVPIKSEIHEGREYRVPLAKGFIEVFEGEMRNHALCVHPLDDYPDGDVALCQILWLESNEEGLLQTANRHS